MDSKASRACRRSPPAFSLPGEMREALQHAAKHLKSATRTRTMNDLSIEELAEQCAAESEKYKQRLTLKTIHCLELFRRAIDRQDQRAWQILYNQYWRQIVKWDKGSGLETEDLLNLIFTRFWKEMQKQEFAARFTSTGAVMAYLKQCVRNLSVDEARKRDRERLLQETLSQESLDKKEAASGSIQKTEEQIFKSERRAYLRRRLKDEEEHLLYTLSYELGFKPQEIAEAYPEQFPTVKKVYRIKERMLARWSNDPVLKSWRRN